MRIIASSQPGRVPSHNQIPVGECARDCRGDIFFQEKSFFDKGSRRVLDERGVSVPRLVPLRDRRSRVLAFLPFRFRAWEWNIRSQQGIQLIGTTDGGRTEIPSRIGGQRNRNLRQSDSRSFV